MSSAEKHSLASNVFGSSVSGIISRSVTHPLDTVKAKLQANQQTFSGPFDALSHTLRSEGLRGLYRGFGTVIVGGTPGTVIYLCSYDVIKQMGNDNFATHFCAGMLAETLACIIYVPVDVIKERLQVQHALSTENYASGWDGLRRILRDEGIRGIYRGYGATLASFGPFSALYFVFYEECKRLSREYVQRRDNNGESSPLPWIVLSSATASAAASWITSPLDMAKLRLQVQRGMVATESSSARSNNKVLYSGFIDCLARTYRDNGVRSLFRGAGARVLYFAPATTISMTTYESCRSLYETLLV